MIVLNEKWLRSLAECGKFPIYLYWDAAKNRLDFDVTERNDAIGSIWKNPFGEAKAETFVPTDLNEQEICRKVNDIIGQKLQVYPEQVVPSAAPYFDLGADSLDRLKLLWLWKKLSELRFLNKKGGAYAPLFCVRRIVYIGRMLRKK